MSGLRRVFADRAGPTAVGILVPPGLRTVVVVRPRGLAWDLLPVEDRGDVIRFRDFDRTEAEAVAEAIARVLEDWAGGRPGQAEPVPAPGSPGCCIRARLGGVLLIACPREPGRHYRPMVFANHDEAEKAATALASALCPPPGRTQEVYFNTRNFAR